MVVTMISTMSLNLSVPPSLSSLLTALMIILIMKRERGGGRAYVASSEGSLYHLRNLSISLISHHNHMEQHACTLH